MPVGRPVIMAPHQTVLCFKLRQGTPVTRYGLYIGASIGHMTDEDHVHAGFRRLGRDATFFTAVHSDISRDPEFVPMDPWIELSSSSIENFMRRARFTLER